MNAFLRFPAWMTSGPSPAFFTFFESTITTHDPPSMNILSTRVLSADDRQELALLLDDHSRKGIGHWLASMYNGNVTMSYNIAQGVEAVTHPFRLAQAFHYPYSQLDLNPFFTLSVFYRLGNSIGHTHTILDGRSSLTFMFQFGNVSYTKVIGVCSSPYPYHEISVQTDIGLCKMDLGMTHMTLPPLIPLQEYMKISANKAPRVGVK